MIKLPLVLALFIMTFAAIAQDPKEATISVTVENVLADGGTVLASLHNESTFMKGDGVFNAAEPAKKGKVILTFENVTQGTYALMVIHDANDNKQMDFDSSGIPTESYAVSGTLNLYGPPVFMEAKFDVDGEDQEIRIRF